jgi:hypothetical protein
MNRRAALRRLSGTDRNTCPTSAFFTDAPKSGFEAPADVWFAVNPGSESGSQRFRRSRVLSGHLHRSILEG